MAYWVPADGSAEPERLFEGDHGGGLSSFSPDGDLVAFRVGARHRPGHLGAVPEGHGTPQPFLRTRFTEVGSKFSPDGRWISYVSDESGQFQVYVRPYPGPGGKLQVSTHGGGSKSGRAMAGSFSIGTETSGWWSL